VAINGPTSGAWREEDGDEPQPGSVGWTSQTLPTERTPSKHAHLHVPATVGRQAAVRPMLAVLQEKLERQSSKLAPGHLSDLRHDPINNGQLHVRYSTSDRGCQIQP
jgi:hypothetical protein